MVTCAHLPFGNMVLLTTLSALSGQSLTKWNPGLLPSIQKSQPVCGCLSGIRAKIAPVRFSPSGNFTHAAQLNEFVRSKSPTSAKVGMVSPLVTNAAAAMTPGCDSAATDSVSVCATPATVKLRLLVTPSSSGAWKTKPLLGASPSLETSGSFNHAS